MSKVLSNPFATQPVQAERRQTIGDVLTDLGTGIDTFFSGIDSSLGVKLPESKRLPLRPEYLTYEDDAFDLGWLTMVNNRVVRTDRPYVQPQQEDVFATYGVMI